jgi:hypothetical protein
MYAINKIEKACIPPEFEKASINNPNKKDRVKNGTLFVFKGYRKTKTIYK